MSFALSGTDQRIKQLLEKGVAPFESKEVFGCASGNENFTGHEGLLNCEIIYGGTPDIL